MPAAVLPVQPLVRHTAAHGHRLVFELSRRNPKMIKRWPPHVTTTRRTRSKPTASSSDQGVKRQAEVAQSHPPDASQVTAPVMALGGESLVSPDLTHPGHRHPTVPRQLRRDSAQPHLAQVGPDGRSWPRTSRQGRSYVAPPPPSVLQDESGYAW